MSLPLFPSNDPGPSFSELLKRVGGDAVVPEGTGAGGDSAPQVTHGTTVVAIRYADGVVMAGDRRATEGYSIAHRAIEKVFPADRHSGVSIAGLYEAADEDTATGGPDPVRGIYPTVANITADGFERVPDDEVAERFQALIQRKAEAGHPA